MAGATIANAGPSSRGPQGPQIAATRLVRPSQEHTVHFARRHRRAHAADCFPVQIGRGHSNMGLGTNAVRPQDAVLQNPLVDVWHHHMRRDENDSCGAIPRTRDEWPILSDEQIWTESNMSRVSKVPDPRQMTRIWNYVPPRAGPSRLQESRRQVSQIP